MKILFDFLPILLFFIAYKVGDIYMATGVAIITSILLVAYSRYQTGRFEKMPLFTLATVVILGGATLIFRNELFIKWKPTAIYWLFAAAFLTSQFWGQKPLFRRFAEHLLQLPNAIWYHLNLSWALFFGLLGLLNIYVIYNFDTNTWVNFKLFGTTGLTVIFVILQGFYMARHILPTPETENSKTPSKQEP